MAQQIMECHGFDHEPPRFPIYDILIHDHDRRFGTTFYWRLQNFRIAKVRIPLRSPQANAIAEHWVLSVRTECLDQMVIFKKRRLRQL